MVKHITVTGRVQGVSYRYCLQREARRLGVRGWCRNLPTGDQVEALLVGEAQAVAVLLAWCWHGPPQARVESVFEDVQTERTFDTDGLAEQFEVRR